MTALQAQPPVTVSVFAQRCSATRRGATLARRLAVWQLDVWGVNNCSYFFQWLRGLVCEYADVVKLREDLITLWCGENQTAPGVRFFACDTCVLVPDRDEGDWMRPAHPCDPHHPQYVTRQVPEWPETWVLPLWRG